VSVLVYAVAASGLNTTLKVHEAPTANVAPQEPGPPCAAVALEKGCGVPPPKVAVPPDSATLPVLVTVRVNALLVVPVAQLPKAVAAEVAVVGTWLHCTRIVHGAPAANVAPQLSGTPVVTRENGPLKAGAGMVNVVVPLFDSVKSRVARPEPATTSVNPSGAGLAATSVLPAAIWNSTAPTSAGLPLVLGRERPKKSLPVVAGSRTPPESAQTTRWLV